MRAYLLASITVVIALSVSACGSNGDGGSTSTGGGGRTGTGTATGTGGSADGGSTHSGGGGSGAGNVVSPSCAKPSPAFSQEEQKLVDLPADSWWQAPKTPIRPVCPAGASCNIIDPWSGGVYDDNQNQLLLFGGGHSDYSGNELYAFEIGTLTWKRLTDPSSPEYTNVDPLPDGNPVSRHTYDGLAFISHANKLFANGGSIWNAGGGTGVTWTFDVGTKTWKDEKVTAPPTDNCCGAAAEYDPVTKKVYAWRTQGLDTYDLDANTWTEIQSFEDVPLWPRYEVWGDKVGRLDPKRRLLFFFGSNAYLVWDIDKKKAVTDDWVTTGGTTANNMKQVPENPEQLFTSGGAEIWQGDGPGLDYDPTSDSMIGWVGGGPWVLSLASKAWTQANGTGAPAKPAQNGTYGRFRYLSRVNVFVLVNSVDDSVWFYKHTAGCGT